MPIIENNELYSVAIGRYSAKIPKNMRLTDATISKNGIPIKVYFNYIKQRAERLVDSTWADIKSGESKRKDQEKQAEISQPSEDTWLIAYNFERLIGPDVFGKPRNKLLNSSLGFAWKNNILLELGGEQTLEDSSRLVSLMSRFSASDDSISGFCFIKGCIIGEDNERESLNISFNDAKNKAFNIAFNIDAYQGEPNLPLSDRKPSIPEMELPGALKWLSDSSNRIKIFKNASRVLNGIKGEEIIEGTTQKVNGNYLTEITGVWYYPGVPKDVHRPEVTITITYSFTSDTLPEDAPSFPNNSQDGVDEGQFLSVWNDVLESFHPRNP